jgi:hypothetical protein
MTTVERWDTHEIALEATGSYENPFRDLELTASFTHRESGRSITATGFYDGETTWRVRLLPLEVGAWEYHTHSADPGLDGRTGTLECVAPQEPYLHGPLQANGHHFFHADGTPRFLIGTRLSCQFADPKVWPALMEFLRQHAINRVLFMMPGIQGMFQHFYGRRQFYNRPELTGIDYWRYNVERFQAIDAFIDALRRADILAAPYFYYFNDWVQRGMTPEQDRAYVRYGMARFGAYANVMPCLSNEVEQKFTDRLGQYDLNSHVWANEIGAYLAERAVFGLPVTVHSPLETSRAVRPSFYTLLYDWPFPWASHMLRQAQMSALSATPEISDDLPEQRTPISYTSRGYARHNQMLIDLRRFGIPVINEEPGYERAGDEAFRNSVPARSQNTERLLSTFWTAATAGAYSMWGSEGTYMLDDPLPAMQQQARTARMLRVLHDCMAELPYWEMAPANELVSASEEEIEGKPYRTNFCLAKEREVYLVFSLNGGPVTLHLSGGRYRLTQVDPYSGERTALGEVDGGTQSVSVSGHQQVVVARRA